MKSTPRFIRFILALFVLVTACAMSGYVLADTEDGIHSYSIGEFEKAEAIFDDILKGDPDNVQTGYYMGLTLLMQEKYEKALGVFQNLKESIDKKKVMKNDSIPTKGQIEVGIVRAYLGLKKYPEALESINAAEKTKADPIDIHTYKGAYYLEINENSKADEELKKALDLNSKNPYTYYYAGIATLRMGNAAKAVKLLEIFLNLAPYAPEAEHTKYLVDTLC